MIKSLFDQEAEHEGDVRGEKAARVPALLARLRAGWRFEWSVVAALLVLKLSLFWFAAHAYVVVTDEPTGSFRGMLAIWNRWDAPHYLDIARHGYVSTGEERLWIVFYPLFPLCVRAFAYLTRDYLTSAILVSTLASIAAALLLLYLARLDADEATARLSVLFLYTFPTSYFLHIGYTESLFLAVALGSFLAARRDRWLLAGTLAALACLARVNGLMLVPALACEALAQYRVRRRFEARWLWLLLAGTGTLAYLILNKIVLDDFFAFSRVASGHWSKSLTWPWEGLYQTYKDMSLRSPSEAQMVGWEELLFAALGLASTVWCWLRLRLSYSVWMTLNWLLFTATTFILSTPRYTLILFPIYLLLAGTARAYPTVGVVVICWSLPLLGLFVSRFVQGLWAF